MATERPSAKYGRDRSPPPIEVGALMSSAA